MAHGTHTRVMLKILCVEEGVMEICCDSKWKCFGENGKSQNAQGPMASVLKSVPPVDNAHIELKSEQHMVLPYRPYMKHIHPRANTNMCTFVVEGSMLHYVPCASEFEIDESSTVPYDQESRQTLYFRLDESGDADMKSLWFCTSLQSAKAEQLMRCEQVGTNVTEDIPIGRLCYAIRKSDTKSIAPYDANKPLAHAVPANTASKMAQKKHGKMEANIHTAYPTSGMGHM